MQMLGIFPKASVEKGFQKPMPQRRGASVSIEHVDLRTVVSLKN